MGVIDVLRQPVGYAAIFTHDSPAQEVNEQSTEVPDGPESVVFDEAENRLHSEIAVLVKLLSKKIFKP